MLTYCPRCKTTLTLEQFEASERCPCCGYNFNIIHYVVVLVLGLVFGAGPWLLATRFPKEQWGVIRAVSLAMLTLVVVDIVGDLIMFAMGVPRAHRRRIAGWSSVILAIIVGVAVK